jgi:glutamate-1-semialdehyde 2,1-aminomutase
MTLETAASKILFEKAKALMPGGVNSPVRSFSAVGGNPVFIKRAKGALLYDEDGNRYIDFVASWGPIILGHADDDVVNAVKQAAELGTSYGAPCKGEVELAERVIRAFPSIEIVRMTSSGTEATMSAVRLARAFTGRDLLVKFEGCYHGHADYLLVKAGSGATTFGTPSSPGVPDAFSRCTLLARYNDLDSVRSLFKEHGRNIAGVIIEPVAGNMGVVTPEPGFLEGLREITSRYRALLIFDEVISGFRLAPGGAQELYGIHADITCLGKIIGGGLPVGAYGGRREIMEMVAPSGPVYQAGTLSGNPLAMAAGIATLDKLVKEENYRRLEAISAELVRGLESVIKKTGARATINRAGSMFTIFFTEGRVTDYTSALGADVKRYARFFKGLLDAGIMFPPSQFESVFVSLSHTEEDMEQVVSAAARVLGN